MDAKWGIVRTLIDGLVERAPKTGPSIELLTEAIELQRSFASLEGELAGARSLQTALAAQRAINPAVAEQVWRGLEGTFLERLRSFLSDAVNLEMRIGLAKKRGRTKSGNHALDHEIACLAFVEARIHGSQTLRSAILKEAARRGLNFEGGNADPQADTLYRRIKAIVDDPLENVEGRVAMVLRSIPEKRSKEQKSDEPESKEA